MKLIKCDKCGEIFDPYDSRRIEVRFGEGPYDYTGCYTWQGIKTRAYLNRDVCPKCWKKFVKKMNKYFDSEIYITKDK